MAEPDDAQRAAILAELQRRGIAVPADQATPAAPDASGASEPVQSPTPDPAAAPEQPGFISRAANDVAAGLPEITGAIVRGVGQAVESTGGAISEGLKALQSTGKVGQALSAGIQGAAPGLGLAATANEWLGKQITGLFDKPTTVTGQLTEGIAQFVTGMFGGGKYIRAAEGAGVATKVGMSILQNGAVSGVVFGGHEERLSNLIEQYPALQNPVSDFLAAKPGDSEAEGRFKNALEGMIVGPLADALVWSVKSLKGVFSGDTKAVNEATKELEKILGQMESPEAVAAKALDPDNGVKPTGEPVAPKAVEEPKPVVQAADEGIPQAETVAVPKAAHDAPAPFAEDLRTGAEATPPLPAFKLSDVLPKVTNESGEKAVEALQRRFTMNPDDGGLLPINPTQRFNLDRIDSPETLKAALDAITTVGEGAIKKARVHEVYDFGKVVKEAQEFTDIVGTKPSDFLAVLAHDAKTAERQVARMRAYRMMMVDSVDRAAELADKALTMKGTAEGQRLAAQAVHAANLATQVTAMVKGIESGVARTLGANRMAARSSKVVANWDLEALAKQMESGAYHADDEMLMLVLKNLKGNPKGFNRFMEKTAGGKIRDAYTTWLYNAMLSNPTTWVANTISNIAMAHYGPIERALAGAVHGASPTAAARSAVQMKDEYVGMYMGLMDSFKAAGKAMKTGVSILDPKNGTKMGPDGSAVDGLSSRALGFTKDIYSPTGELISTTHTPVLSMLTDAISSVVNIPSKMLQGGDELTKQVVYRGFLYSQAAQAARTRGLTGKSFNEFVADQMERGFADGGNLKAVGAAENKAGLQAAREATFTQDLEYGISRWVQGMSNDSLIARHVVPFVRTPVNIFRFSWKHTPLLNAFEEGVRRDWKLGGEARAKVYAQMTTGAAMWSAAGFMAYNGMITGSAPLDPELRKAKEATGWKEYSLKVGDKYYQLNRLDPFATFLGVAADFSTLTAHVGQNELDKIGYGMVLAMGKNLTSKTYMQGVMNLFNAVGDLYSGRSSYGMDAWVHRTIGSIIVPSGVNRLKGEFDDSLREVRSVLDAVKSRLPGYSKDVPPVRNILGEVVEAPKSWGPDMLSPIGVTTQKHDKVYDKLAEMMLEVNSPIGRLDPTLPGTKIDLREVKLANGRNAYDRMQEILWQSGVKKQLEKLFDSPGFQKAGTGSLDFARAPGTKLHMTNSILSQYRENARNRLLAENPELIKMYVGERRRNARTSVDGEGERLYQPPGVLDSLMGGKKNDLRAK